ncbi:MAG TPA: Fur family transcriptional regulator [Nitrospirota bacterium]
MENYRDIGLKLTPQRLAILDYLKGNKKHPSAEEIYRAVHRKFPTMSLATVYNTLSALARRERVLELTIDPGKKRYDPNTGPHSHLICIFCKKIVDGPDEYLPELPASAKRDFTVVKSLVEFYGICPECKKNQNKPVREASHVHRS